MRFCESVPSKRRITTAGNGQRPEVLSAILTHHCSRRHPMGRLLGSPSLLEATMTTTLPLPSPTSPPPIPYEKCGFSWAAVLAGLTIAAALDIGFAELMLAMNLGMIDRHDNAGAIIVGNAVAAVILGLIALAVGAWVAGRMANARTLLEGGVHGLGVWAAGAAVMVVLAFSTLGALASGMLGVLGQGLQGAAVATGKAAEIVAPTWDGIRDELLEVISTPAGEDGETRSARLLERSRLLEIAASHFSAGELRNGGERAELVQLLARQGSMTETAAGRIIEQWDRTWARARQTYDTAKQEAQRLAEVARHQAMSAAGWATVAMLLGAATAAVAGAWGGACRWRWHTRVLPH